MTDTERTYEGYRRLFDRIGGPDYVDDQDRLDWAERSIRLLSRHYQVSTIQLFFDAEHGDVLLIASDDSEAGASQIGGGKSFGSAIEDAIHELSDAEILAASADTPADAAGAGRSVR